MTANGFAVWCQRVSAHGPVPLSPEQQQTIIEHGLDGRSAESQTINWNPASWHVKPAADRSESLPAEFGAAVQELKDSLHESTTKPGHLKITRADVRARGGDPFELLVAAMAWGYGNSGYGFFRTRRVFEQNSRNAIVDLVTRLTDVGATAPEQTWRVCEILDRLRYLGPAFSTKVAHFAGYDMAAGRGPLIADANTAWGIRALTGGRIHDIRTDPSMYGEYVSAAESLATATRTSADVEYALFRIGQEGRQAKSPKDDRKRART